MTARRSGALQDIQENRCFYCGSAMKQDPHVDHFIGNLDKGDMLGAPAHLAHWVKRNRESGADLAARLSPAGFLDDQAAALQVARWAYRQAEATSAQLWVGLKYTVNAERNCLEILAA